jgi:hypothetical protein
VAPISAARRHDRTRSGSWNPGHIGERDGPFTLIVLRESVFGSATAVGAGLAVAVDGVLDHSALTEVETGRAAGATIATSRRAPAA